MSAISDKAIKKNTTPYKYDGGNELEDELNYYNTFYRKYDLQIGRFTGVDMLGEKYAGLTPYQFGNNNPVLFNDPKGDKIPALMTPQEPDDRHTLTGGGGWLESNGNYIAEQKMNEGLQRINDLNNYFNLLYSLNNSPLIQQLWNVSDPNGKTTFDLTEPDKLKGYYYNNANGVGQYVNPTYQGTVHYSSYLDQTFVYVGYVGDFSNTSDGGEQGGSRNGWEKASLITETTAFSFETTVGATIGVQRISNWVTGASNKILGAGELGELAGNTLAVVGAGFTVADGVQNGWKSHHTADLALDLAIYTISAQVPVVGWIVGGSYLIGNIICEQYTGKSVTEYYFDNP